MNFTDRRIWMYATFSALVCLFAVNLETAAADDDADINLKRRYARLLSLKDRTKNGVFRDSIRPHWFGPDDRWFWYKIETASDQYRFVLVDSDAGKRADAFDHQALSQRLSDKLSVQFESLRLPIEQLRFNADATQAMFVCEKRSWTFGLPDGPLSPVDEKVSEAALEPLSTLRVSSASEKRTKIRFVNRLADPLQIHWIDYQGNLVPYDHVSAGGVVEYGTYQGHVWVLNRLGSEIIASFAADDAANVAIINETTAKPEMKWDLDRDRKFLSLGSPDKRWQVKFQQHNVMLLDKNTGRTETLTHDGTESMSYGRDVYWSPDSERFFLMRTRRGEHRKISMVDSAPDDSVQPQLKTIAYEKPGDQRDRVSIFLFDKSDGWRPQRIEDELFSNPFNLSRFEWHTDGNSFSFVHNQRGHQRLDLITVEAKTGIAKRTLSEQSDTFVCYSSKTYLRRLDETDEFIWMSERSGWNHVYLCDSKTGQIKNAITEGNWVVRSVEIVDVEARQVWLTVSGIDEDQDPYHRHLVRVDFDGKNLTRMTGGDGEHSWQFSPGNRYLIDRFSRVDMPPVSVLRDAKSGLKVCDLEQADASALIESGWRMPERFVAKGRDGKTDIHGVIVRPTDFDPTKSYPIVENIYAGPHSSFVPKSFGVHRGLQEIAELGFIVAKIDGMGTSNRSKSFHDVCWQNLHDSGFPDRVAWIKAAAADRPWMDLSHVGIYGGSAGGQSAMRALIDHHDFYHVAVADCGCHDNRVDKIWWNEQWMGWPIGDCYEASSNVQHAHRMKGDLLLIWGELDTNVDPASTMQVVDALVKADKDFEMLCIPGAGHGAAGGPYAKRKQAEFLMRKLRE